MIFLVLLSGPRALGYPCSAAIVGIVAALAVGCTLNRVAAAAAVVVGGDQIVAEGA